MFVLVNKLLDMPVLGLRAGNKIAVTESLIINPKGLKVEGFYCRDILERRTRILLVQDIRDLAAGGIIINDQEVLADYEDLVRLQPVLEMDFNLMRMPVYTESKKRVGKVSDFAVDDITFYVQKLYVTQSLIKYLGGTVSVDRKQIAEITDKRIIVKDPKQPLKKGVLQPSTATSDNLAMA